MSESTLYRPTLVLPDAADIRQIRMVAARTTLTDREVSCVVNKVLAGTMDDGTWTRQAAAECQWRRHHPAVWQDMLDLALEAVAIVSGQRRGRSHEVSWCDGDFG